MINCIAPNACASWKALETLVEQEKSIHLRDRFKQDAERATRFSASQPGFLYDYSKQRISASVMEALLGLARETGVAEAREAMFRGEPINATERRSVLHTALRNPKGTTATVDGQAVAPLIQAALNHMADFSARVISGQWTGYTGKKITDIVNIGIGGSDLGPAMVYEALKPYHVPPLRGHFVSNVDAAHLHPVLREVNPETTLFIIASKTFTTAETMLNAHTARTWFLEQTGAEETALGQHFVALSTNQQAATAFGILPENLFVFWDWVGCRYSVWSSIGLSLSLLLGHAHFEQLLEGAHALDTHFQTAAPEENIPLLMALISIWNTHFLGYQAEAVIPYDQRLARFPAYLQQLSMESNGKGVDRSGQPVRWKTAPIAWGEPGTNGQHAFFQQLHQGTEGCPVDFILAAKPHHPYPAHHEALVANALAQAQALMQGKTREEALAELLAAGKTQEEAQALAPFKTFPGNRPSSFLFVDELNPARIGYLIALYEQKVFCMGWVLGLYSFDQWGVELGKQLAQNLQPMLKDFQQKNSGDNSTNMLINWYIATLK